MHLQGWDVPHQEKQPLVSALPPLDPSAHQTATKKTTIKDASLRFFILFYLGRGGVVKQTKEKGNK